ncbi:hypothetical protein ACA910_012696 [Epithemia clementina (nom. ined.)]
MKVPQFLCRSRSDGSHLDDCVGIMTEGSPSLGGSSIVLRNSNKTGGYEGGTPHYCSADEETIPENGFFHTPTTEGTISTRFSMSMMEPPSVAATEHALNCSGMSATGRSTASTVMMGSGRNQRARRRPPIRKVTALNPSTEVEQQSPSDPAQELGPLWRAATEEGAAQVRRFSLQSSDRSTSSSPLPVKVLDMNKALTQINADYGQEASKSLKGRQGTRTSASTASMSQQTTPNEQQNEQPKSSGYRFEFGDVVTSRSAQKLNIEDDMQSGNDSVYSFSFSEDDEGTGFELDGFQGLGHLYGMQSADVRDESSESSCTFDGETTSDRDLMERCASPGAIRLTEAGLSRHEKDTFKELLKEQPSDPIMAWKNGHEARKWYRQRQAERAAERQDRIEHQPPPLQDRAGRPFHPSKLRDSDIPPQPPPPPGELRKSSSGANKLKLGAAQLLAAPFRKGPDAAETAAAAAMSLGPPAPDDDSDTWKNCSYKYRGSDDAKTAGIINIFRKRSNRSTASAGSERDSNCSGNRKKDTVSYKPDKDRNESKRRFHNSDGQRTREGLPLPPSRDSTPSKKTGSREDQLSTPGATTTTKKTKPGTPTSSLPPCVICHRGKRTHIATPCMHFSFCATCAIRLGDRGPCDCPVCHEPHVAFAAVSV